MGALTTGRHGVTVLHQRSRSELAVLVSFILMLLSPQWSTATPLTPMHRDKSVEYLVQGSSSPSPAVVRVRRKAQYDPSLVQEVQEHLKRLGFFTGTIDGQLRRETKRAIILFQKNAGLRPTGRPTDDVVDLLRERVKTATPHGRILAKHGRLEAYVGPGRWCRNVITVTIRASEAAAFEDEKHDVQRLVGPLRETLARECPRVRRTTIVGLFEERQVYSASLDQSGRLTARGSRGPDSPGTGRGARGERRQTGSEPGTPSVCAEADPQSFEQVFACMSSAREGAGAGRNRFEGNISTSDCRSITATYIDVLRKEGRLPRDVAMNRAPSCALLARAVMEITGKPAYWSDCLGYGQKPVRAHMKACLEGFVPGYYGSRTKVVDRVHGCAEAIPEYENGLRKADKNGHLPSAYTTPSCDVALDLVSEWTGAPATASACTDYDPTNVKAHLERCLGESVELSTLRTCGHVRRTYEDKLVQAHGRLPSSYVMLPCSVTSDILAKAKDARKEQDDKRLAAALERQKRRAQSRGALDRSLDKKARAPRERSMSSALQETSPQVSPDPSMPSMSEPSGAAPAQQVPRARSQAPQRKKSVASPKATMPPTADRQIPPKTRDALQKLAAEQDKLERSLDKLSEELLDNRVQLARVTFSNENYKKIRDLCFKLYKGLEQELVNRRIRRGMRGRGYPRHLKTYEAYVHHSFWTSVYVKKKPLREESKRCGWWFVDELGRHRMALPYALASFYTYHNLDPQDDDSAGMISAIYRTGRGGQPNPKLAKQWYAKAKKRKAKVRGQVGKPVEGKDGKFTLLDYGEVPEGFVPTLPDLPENRSLIVKMEKITPQSLTAIRIDPFGRWHLMRNELDYMGQPRIRQVISEDSHAVIQSNALVLECRYNSDKYKTTNFYRYWYEKRPAAADPARLRSRMSQHPLLFLRSPLSSCPGNRDEARNHR